VLKSAWLILVLPDFDSSKLDLQKIILESPYIRFRLLEASKYNFYFIVGSNNSRELSRKAAQLRAVFWQLKTGKVPWLTSSKPTDSPVL
jgi:hypothetical protein